MFQFERAHCLEKSIRAIANKFRRQAPRASIGLRVIILAVCTLSPGLILPNALGQSVELSIDASKTGATIDRNLFGQFAEHLGHGMYDGIWVGTDSPIRIPAASATMWSPR